jgi:hypothetical protein
MVKYRILSYHEVAELVRLYQAGGIANLPFHVT